MLDLEINSSKNFRLNSRKKIYKELNSEKIIISIFINLANAFDILGPKLEHFRVCNALLT